MYKNWETVWKLLKEDSNLAISSLSNVFKYQVRENIKYV